MCNGQIPVQSCMVLLCYGVGLSHSSCVECVVVVMSNMARLVSPVQHSGIGPVVHFAGQKKRVPPQAAAHS